MKSKLLSIQMELKAPKGQYNSFGKYNYRNCEDILEAVKPLLAKHKVAIILEDELKNIGERYYVQATATLMDTETDKQISVTAFAREEETKKGMDSSQITGAASSYARKYALNGLLAIDDTQDSDTTNTHDKNAKRTEKSANNNQLSTDLHLMGVDIPKLAKWFGVTLDKLTDEMKEMALKQKRNEITMLELEEYRFELNGN